ncbi:hypothetical protein Anas_06083 [Armadillidium nasatum]|uniref:Uncharacterized protein n=1 Tax=Armadillidium nasatum TaxID=96803 RepID=A0A5N5SSQ6_9CRUS|nr:hypothetical protein Anas_06083 [Armadillidium nasatum]
MSKYTVIAYSATTPCYSNAYDHSGQSGYYYTFQAYISDLSTIGFDNAIYSVLQTGMWIYYENINYNGDLAGQVYWVHGVDIAVDFPSEVDGVTSSLKYAGNRYVLNEDSYTIYSGEFYTGDEFYGNVDTASLSSLTDQGSSIILTGLSDWTFYTEYDFGGYAYCFSPSTDRDVGLDGTVLNFGFYGSLSSAGVPDNYFRSVRKGCFSPNIVKASPMKAEGKSSNGAWGVIRV